MTKKKSVSKIIRITAFILLCVFTLCAQECDTSWIGELAGALLGTGLTLIGMDSQKAQEIGAGLAITGLIIDKIRSNSTNYNPGISQKWIDAGLVAQNSVIENRNRQVARQARIEEIRTEHERQTQEIRARFENSWTKEPINSSSITMNSSQNIGNPQVNPVVNSARVPTRRRDPRKGNYYANQDRQLTGRNNQSAHPNAANAPSRAGRADAGPGYGQSTQQPTTRPAPSDGAASTASVPRPSNPVRSATVPTPPASVRQETTIIQNSQAKADNIAQFTPRQSYDQGNNTAQTTTISENLKPRPSVVWTNPDIDWTRPSSQITNNFTVGEAILLRDWGFYHIPNEIEKQNIIRMAIELQKIREQYDKAIVINSWLRPKSVNPGRLVDGRIISDPNATYTHTRNDRVGGRDGTIHPAMGADYNWWNLGATNSAHLDGHGVDLRLQNYNGNNFESELDAWWNCGLGYGQRNGRNFTHLDLGGRRRWNY